MSIKPLRLPPQDLSQLSLEAVTLPPAGWVRLHYPGRALHFTVNPEHRFTPEDAKYRVLYLARDEQTAVLEIFGDRIYSRKQGRISRAEWNTRELSRLLVPPLKVADLTQAAMVAARVDLAALANRSRRVTHLWGGAVMNHPDGFHGLLYMSRFTGNTCLALFQCPEDPAPTVEGAARSFANQDVATNLLRDFAISLT